MLTRCMWLGLGAFNGALCSDNKSLKPKDIHGRDIYTGEESTGR